MMCDNTDDAPQKRNERLLSRAGARIDGVEGCLLLGEMLMDFL